MRVKYQNSGMALAVCLIFLAVITELTLVAMENNLLNQKMSAAFQAQIIALNSAEAGLMAEIAQQNGQHADLSNIKGELDYRMIADSVDDCQQHTLTITAKAVYQNARIKLIAGYLQPPATPPPGCAVNPSHWLWWQQVDT